jgi:hypothetical protein
MFIVLKSKSLKNIVCNKIPISVTYIWFCKRIQNLSCDISEYIHYIEFINFNISLFFESRFRLLTRLNHLNLRNKFNHSIDTLLFILTYLHTGSKFNRSVDRLPTTLMYFILSNTFNLPVDCLFSRLTHLNLKNYFNQ